MKTVNQNLGNNQFTVAPHQLKHSILDPDYSIKFKRKNYPQKNIYTLPNLLQAQECQQLIALGKRLGFQQAGLAIGQDIYRIKEQTRNNKRVIFESKAMAAQLWGRMGQLCDQRFQNHQVAGLNWRFRLYEYPTGGIFAPHVDERMVLEDGKLISLFTFMIYLNDNLEGGETTFFERRHKGNKRPKIQRSIRPKTGMGLAFDHLLFHEGSVVTKGFKYALRSDVLYYNK